ncbi:MAG: choice-of-anchor J domain-containing protein [Candidatus Eisenbacteria bacterium]
MRNVLVIVLAVCFIVASATTLAAKKEEEHPIHTKGSLNCTGATPISCGDVVAGNNGTGEYNVEYYSCVSYWEYGPEVVYELVIPGPECYQVSASLAGMTADLDVFILGSCDENDCIDYGDVSFTTDCLEPGTYYIVVDGYYGDVSDFTLTVDCTECECPAPCPPEQNYLPFAQDFERQECFPPAGWTILNLGDDTSGEGWEWADYNYCSGLGTSRCYYGGLDEYQDEWFITPIIYLEGAHCIEICFQHYTSIWSYCTHPVELLVSTTGTNTGDFSVIWTFGCDEESFCDQVCIVDPLPPSTDHVYVAWRYQGLWAGIWNVDNILIDVSGASAIQPSAWGAIKSMYR